MKPYRWIVYTSQNIPHASHTLTRVASIGAAREDYRDFCREVGTDECSSVLYPYSAEDWETAQKFGADSCPFDYPSRIIER